jgi:Family of unknown function (DUF6281)
MIGEKELRETLRHYAGPDAPVPPPVRRRWLRPVLVAAVLVAVAAGASVLAFALTRPSSEHSSATGGGACIAMVRFRGVDYVGNKLQGVTLQPAASLGDAEQPGCEGSPTAQVEVVALQGVDPSVAIGRPDEPDAVYVAGGRCSGFTDDRAFVDCLRAAK